jgi:hypothetical protein
MDYSLCDVTFRLVCAPASRMPGVARILESLFVLTGPHHTAHRIDLIVNDAPETEVSGEVVFDAPGLTAIKTPRGYHLRADASFLAIDLPAGRAVGSLSDSFMYTPLEEQRGLFLFALLMLLSGTDSTLCTPPESGTPAAASCWLATRDPARPALPAL